MMAVRIKVESLYPCIGTTDVLVFASPSLGPDDPTAEPLPAFSPLVCSARPPLALNPLAVSVDTTGFEELSRESGYAPRMLMMGVVVASDAGLSAFWKVLRK